MTLTHDEILQGLYDETLVGHAPEVRELVEQGLATELGPERMLYDALIPSLEEVGARFERGDFFVPEMLIAARAMQGALDILRPLLAETGAKPLGTYVMGTVKGDVHDIGKNLVNIMLEGALHRAGGDQHLGHEVVAALEARADLLERRDQRVVEHALGVEVVLEPLLHSLAHGWGVADQRLVVEKLQDLLVRHAACSPSATWPRRSLSSRA